MELARGCTSAGPRGGLGEEAVGIQRKGEDLVGLVPIRLRVVLPTRTHHAVHPLDGIDHIDLTGDGVLVHEKLGTDEELGLLVTGERAVEGLLHLVHVGVVEQVRARIALGPCLAGPDVVGIGGAIELDERVLVRGFLPDDGGAHLVEGIQLRAHEGGDALGVVEGGDGVVEGSLGALIDLLEVGAVLGPDDGVGVEVEGDAALGNAHGGVASLGAVHGGLDGGADGGELLELRDGGAVHLLDALVGRVGIDGHEDGVADDPVDVAAEAGAGGPMVEAPMTDNGAVATRDGVGGLGVGAGAAEFLPSLGLVAIGLAPGEVEDLLAGAGHRDGPGGELSLVLVVHGDGLPEDVHGLDARDPVEPGVHEEGIVTLDGGQVVPVGVAVALRVHDRGVVGVDDAVGRLAGVLLDVVVEGIDHLAGADAAGVVPDEPVIDRCRADTRDKEVVAAAEECELLVGEAGDLALEGKEGGGDVAIACVLGADADGGVGGIGPCLVAEGKIQVMEVSGREEEGVVGGAVVVAGLDAEHAAAAEDGLVDLDEAVVVDRVHVEGDVALPSTAGLGEEADVGVDRVVEHVLQPLAEGVDPGEHALDPALGELGRGPCGPLAIQRVGRIHRTVAHHDVVVGEGLDASPTEGLAREVGAAGEGLVSGHGGVRLGRRAIDGGGDLPLVLELVEAPGEVGGVLQGHELAEGVLGGENLGLADLEGAADLEHVHGHGVAFLGFGKAVGLDDGDVAAAGARGRQGIGVHGGLVAVDLRKVADAHRDGLVVVGDVGAGNVGVLDEGLNVGGEVLDEGVPEGLALAVADRAEGQGGLEVRPAQHVEERVIEPEGSTVEGTLQDEGSLCAAVGVHVEALGEVGRQGWEVDEAAVVLRAHAGGDGSQLVVGQVRELGPGGVVEDDADGGVLDVGGDGLLVEDAGGAHVADAREVERGHGEGGAKGERGEWL